MEFIKCSGSQWVAKDKILGVKVIGTEVVIITDGGFPIKYSSWKTEREADADAEDFVGKMGTGH